MSDTIKQLDSICEELIRLKTKKSELNLHLNNITDRQQDLQFRFRELLNQCDKENWIYNGYIVGFNERERTPSIQNPSLKQEAFKDLKKRFGEDVAWNMFTFSVAKFDSLRKTDEEAFEKNPLNGLKAPVTIKTLSIKKEK